MNKLLIILFLFSTSANADLITYEFSGQIDDARNLISGINDGDIYQGTLSFNRESLPSSYFADISGEYYAEYIVLTNASFQVGSYSFNMAEHEKIEPDFYGPKRSIQIFNNTSYDAIFFTTGMDFDHGVNFGFGDNGISIRLNLYDWDALALNSTEIDTLPAFSLNGFEYNFLEIIAEDFTNPDNDFIVRATLDTLQIIEVPEPTSVLLILGVILIIATNSRKNSNSAFK